MAKWKRIDYKYFLDDEHPIIERRTFIHPRTNKETVRFETQDKLGNRVGFKYLKSAKLRAEDYTIEERKYFNFENTAETYYLHYQQNTDKYENFEQCLKINVFPVYNNILSNSELDKFAKKFLSEKGLEE